MADISTGMAMEWAVNRLQPLLRGSAGRWLFCLSLLTTSACEVRHGNEPQNSIEVTTPIEQAWTKPSTGNPAHDQIVAMTEPERRAIFVRLMESSGERCPSVSRTFYQGMEEGQKIAFWSIDCGKQDWLISIEQDSSTKLLECGMLKAVASTRCWTKFES